MKTREEKIEEFMDELITLVHSHQEKKLDGHGIVACLLTCAKVQACVDITEFEPMVGVLVSMIMKDLDHLFRETKSRKHGHSHE